MKDRQIESDLDPAVSRVEPADLQVPAGNGEPAVDYKSTLARLKKRERALNELLSGSGESAEHDAVAALATAFDSEFCAVALFQPHTPALKLEAVCSGDDFLEPDEWNLSADSLRRMAGAGHTTWHGRLCAADLPDWVSFDAADGVDFCSNILRCNGDVVGFLVYTLSEPADLSVESGADLGHLIASRLSAELELRAERTARRSTEKQFQDVASIAFDWFWEIDEDHCVSYLSERWSSLTGRDRKDVVGLTLHDLGIDASDPRWATLYEGLDTHQPIRGIKTSAVDADRKLRYWIVNGNPWFDERGEFRGYRGTGTDVTAEVKQRHRAEKAERLLRDAIEALPQGFILFDEDDRLVVCNGKYGELHPEITDGLVAGADLFDLVTCWAHQTSDRPDGMSTDELINRRMKAHRSHTREIEFARSSGETFLVNEQKTQSGCSVWMHTDITSLKKRENELQRLSDELRSKNAQLDATINSMGDGLIMHGPDERVMLVNQCWKNMFDIPETMQVTGTAHSEIIAYLEDNGVAPELQQSVRANWERVLREGEVTHKRELADARVIEVKGFGMDDGGVVLTFRDITLAERQAAALREQATQFEALSEALAKQNAYFDGALNAMVQGLATFTPGNRLVVCNRRFQQIFGLPDELVSPGASVGDIGAFLSENGLMPNAAERIEASHETARTEGAHNNTMRFGDGRVFEVQNNRLEDGDLLVAFHEITDLENHARRLDEYAKRLEASNRELQEFAYVASHDLQEPLRKIEAFSDRLRSKYGDELDDTGRAYIERMHLAAQRMRSLIEDLLGYSRITTKGREFEIVALRQVIDGVLNDLEIAIDASGAEIRVSPDLPEIEADAAQMRRLFQNLVSNAIKFRKPDIAPAIEISAELVLATAGDACANVEISVADNGIGFESKYTEQIFKIFHRLHGRSEYEGTGIGLATCRKIVDRHAGSITATSVPDEGTTMTLCLPLSQPSTTEDLE